MTKKVHHKKFGEAFRETFGDDRLVGQIFSQMSLERFIYDYAANLTKNGPTIYEWSMYDLDGFKFIGPKYKDNKYHVYNPGNGFETDVDAETFGMILTTCCLSALSFEADRMGRHEWCKMLSLNFAAARSAAGKFGDDKDVIIYRAID